jgi:hypothetical protein
MKDQALYLEADEDITSAIDKLSKATADSVQIVVPKRSTMLQSVINLKLLKKAAESHHKELVLVTSDKIATDLASRVGLAVAPSVGAKAVLTDAAPAPKLDTADEVIEADEPAPAPSKAAAKPAKKSEPDEVMPLPVPDFNRHDITEDEPAPVEAGAPAAATPAARKLPRAPKVPNFNKLQQRLVWAGLAVVVVAGYFGLTAVLSRANVTLYAAGTKTTIDTSFSVDPNQSSSDTASGVLAGQTVTYTKDLSSQITPTGQQDQGTKATGQITITNCYDAASHTFVSGTRFAAPDGKIFRSTADVVVPGGQGSFFGCTVPGSATVAVQADANGDSYNEAPAAYTLPGLPSSQQTGGNAIKAKGSQMSGGTSKIVTVVSSDDLSKAQASMVDTAKDDGQKALDAKVPSGYMAIAQSTVVTPSNATSNPAAGQPVSGQATITVHVTYSELAVKKTDMQAFLNTKEQAQVGSANQIYDNGLAGAQVTISDKDSAGRQQFHLSTDAYSGAKLDTATIATQLAGKKYGDAVDMAGKLPGVQRATINLSPGWISKLPGAGKVKVTIQVASAS